MDYDRSYIKLKKGEEIYLRCFSRLGEARINVTIKPVTQYSLFLGQENANSLRTKTNAASIAKLQAQAASDFLNKYYHGTMLGKEVLQVDDTDKRVLKTLAETITKDCTTDLEKATAKVNLR